MSKQPTKAQRGEAGMPDIFFEDVVIGNAIRTLPYVLPERELMRFAAAWDPMPMHTDKDFAAAHDGLTAPGIYLLAVKMRLVHSLAQASLRSLRKLACVCSAR